MCNISDDDAPRVIMQINFDAFITSIFLDKIDHRRLKSFQPRDLKKPHKIITKLKLRFTFQIIIDRINNFLDNFDRS